MRKLHEWLKPQDYVLVAGLFLFILAGLFPPWYVSKSERVLSMFRLQQGFHWLFDPPIIDHWNVHIDTVTLFIEWILIGVVTAVVYFILWNRLQPVKPPPYVDD